jgi:hypothetical protein
MACADRLALSKLVPIRELKELSMLALSSEALSFRFQTYKEG